MLILAVVVVVAGLVSGLGRLGAAAHAAARADAVADVTALAAVAGGRPAALSVAGASGGVLVDLVVERDEHVQVSVRTDGLVRVAAARPVRVIDDDRRDLVGG